MGEKNFFQPLTKEDKITVVIYRAGIALSTIIISVAAYMLSTALQSKQPPLAAGGLMSIKFNILLIALYISVGMGVFFIHLYVSKFKKRLKNLYYFSVAALIMLFITGKGDILWVLAHKPYGPMLLVPLSLCLGFITAKEAFCFRLLEGYLLAIIMPLYLMFLSAGIMTIKYASFGLLLIAAMMVLFAFRKVFMPIHYDIGDKSAYT